VVVGVREMVGRRFGVEVGEGVRRE